MTDLASQSLYLVSNELNSTLDDSRRALEDFAEGNAGRDALAKCAGLIHLARGALKIVEVHGAALLAEEMEYTLEYLLTVNNSRVVQEGVEALSRSMVQLPAYLERLDSGGRDIALVLLPLLNDLRAVRGKPLLSEGTLLLLNVAPEQHLGPKAPEATHETDLRSIAVKLRPSFQVALLGWIKNERPEHNLAKLHSISRALEGSATADVAYQLWYVVSGVLEAITIGAVEGSVAIKRLLGQVDRQLKTLIDGGESQLVNAPPVDLMNNLLFYVARSAKSTERINAIRSSFGLDDFLPGEAELEQARAGLAGPSVKLMRTVANAIKEDLGNVKDVLDIFVRTGMSDVGELKPQLDLLKKISDTLGVLGLGALRDKIQDQVSQLQRIVASDQATDESTLIKMAATLLSVEDSLDEQLVRAVMPADSDGEPVTDEAAEYQHVTETVVRECMVNLTKVKDAVTDLVKNTATTQVIDQLTPEIRGITAGLLLLERTRAVAIVDRIGNIILGHLRPGGGSLEPRMLDRLADAIVSVEYYLETISLGRADPLYMLDNADDCLAVLDKALEDTPAAVPEPEPAPRPVSSREPLPVMETLTDKSDPELLELFIEEAKEEVASVQRHFPAWLANQDDPEALITARRSFHTLKGSGRMVGAQLLGEFAWSVENLLNRLINRTREPTDDMIGFLNGAIEALPQLVEQLEIGTQPVVDVNLLMKQADAFADGDPDAANLAASSVRLPQLEVPEEVPEPDQQMDPVLKGIFLKEASGHLAAIEEFLDAQRGQVPPHRVTEAAYRACHTLSGSAKMAGVEPAMAIASPLNDLLRGAFEEQAGLSSDGLAAVVDAVAALQMFIQDLGADREVGDGDYSEIIARLKAAQPQPSEPMDAEPVAEDAAVAEPEESLELDPEIAAIFTEEATELLEQAEESLQSLNQSPADPLPRLSELQRLLHTLKGGARMAGIGAMGNLSHAMETLLAGLADERFQMSEAALGLIQVSIDELHRMRDAASMGRAPGEASQLIEDVEALCRRGGEPAPDTPDSALGAPEEPVERIEELVAASEPEFVPTEVPAEPETFAQTPEPEVLEEPLEELARADLTSVLPPVEALEDSGELEELAEATGILKVSDFPEDDDSLSLVADELADDEEFQSTALPTAETGAPTDAIEAAVAASGADMPGPAADEAVESPDPDEELLPALLDDDGEAETLAEVEFVEVAPPTADIPLVVQPPDPVAPETPQVQEAPETPEGDDRLVASAADSATDDVPTRPAARRPTERQDVARVDADLLDGLLNSAGEISIFQSRLNQQTRSIEFHLAELSQTVTRLREQLRKLEAETEAQILYRHQQEGVQGDDDFDPLELDRYSTIQQLSRALAESVSDVASINDLLRSLNNDAETLVTQQGRVTTELQDGLMRTRMVPFQRHVSRLSRIVRQVSADTGKPAELQVTGASGELDRQVLERMLPPLEHLLRNAVVHGIESIDERRRKQKPDAGQIVLNVQREGPEVLIQVSDDGAGLNLTAIRKKAIEQKLIEEDVPVSDDEAMRLILSPGFSTAGELTQAAGRGVGMDVVDTEVKRLGGSLQIQSDRGDGTQFSVRLPYTLAITQALIVRVGEETFALPLPTVEGITRLPKDQLLELLTQDEPQLDYGGSTYRIQHLGMFVDAGPSALPDDETSVPLVLVRAGDASAALLTDQLEGSREIVVKTLGPQITSIPGVSGATILGDGRIVVILDAGSLVRARRPKRAQVPKAPAKPADERPSALVVDDSITVRRVTQRLLERHGMKVTTAKDGIDAIARLQESEPDIILLDIEMPRMDGYQFASHVRNDPEVKEVPIVMITSRSSEKHRAKAIELGVNDYLSKPYQERELIASIEPLIGRSL